MFDYLALGLNDHFQLSNCLDIILAELVFWHTISDDDFYERDFDLVKKQLK